MGKVDISGIHAQTATGFASWVWAFVKGHNLGWRRHDVYEWLKTTLPRFGTPGYDWTVGGALDCAEAFMEQSNQW